MGGLKRIYQGLSLAMVAVLAAACAEDRVIGPMGDDDAGNMMMVDGSTPPIDSSGPAIDGPPGSSECDMTGRWIVAQVVFAKALGATQKTVNWFYHDITQTGDAFTINNSLDCGFRVTGSATVTLNDATLEALAKRSTSVGRKGTFKALGAMCQFDLARTYCLRGANVPMFLSNHWKLGDADKDLSTFPALPANAGAGMEDWDMDNMEAITMSAGTLGNRYVAQRDWNQHNGAVPKNATMFGGMGVIVVDWNTQEAVSTQTSALLRTTATKDGMGYALWAKVTPAELTVVTTGRAELETCKNVQRLANTKFPNP